MTIEVADFEVLENDGRRAIIEFRVWDGERIAPVRCQYVHGSEDGLVRLDQSGPFSDAELFVLLSEECKSDAREALAYQRDLNKEKN